jgi:protein-disulfide isomerase
MKLSLFALTLFSVFSALVLLGSCSKSNGKPNYVYKSAPAEGVVAKFGDRTFTQAELTEGIESELFDAEMKVWELKQNKIQSLIMEEVMSKDPNKKGLSNDEYMDKVIAKGLKISDKDIDAFIAKQKIPAEHINPTVRDRIRDYLLMDKKKEAMDQWLSKQTAKNPVEIYLTKPRRPTFPVEVGNAPIMGGKDAKVTIVEFSDFQCPFCSKGATIVQELKKKYGNKIKIAFKNFPLPFHNQAEGAAVAGLCAKEQGEDYFWKLHDHMFANQEALDVESLKKAAQKLGLKADPFNQCLANNKYLNQVKKDIEEGQKIKVKSTPTFFVNGQLVNGAQPIEVFSELIDESLSL